MPNRRDLCPTIAGEMGAGPIRRTAIHLAFISTAILAAYHGLWRAYFSHDDFWMYGSVRFLPLREAMWFEAGYAVRVLLDASMWLKVRLFGLDAAPYYYCSLLQHALVTFLVYVLTAIWTRRAATALIAALLFGTTFANRGVVTWITGSEYSLAAVFYLGSLVLFDRYVRSPHVWWYVASLTIFVAGLLVHEVVVSLPLVLVAYHLTIGRREAPFGWADLRLHLPFWIVLGLYGAIQVWFIVQGTSEAHLSEVGYGPGLHMLGNLFYLGHLIVPNVSDSVLTDWFGPRGVTVITAVKTLSGLALNGLAIGALVKGSPLVRFAVAFCYLAFLPFTPWHGRFAGASRYLYVASVGFSIAVAVGAVALQDLLSSRRGTRYAVPMGVAALVLFNVLTNHVWVDRHIANGKFRRAVVEDLASDFAQIEPGSAIFIEVPRWKYVDLGFACQLVFRQRVSCTAFVPWQSGIAEAIRQHQGPVYCIEATDDGARASGRCGGSGLGIGRS